MAYQPPLNGGRINASIGGNTVGAGALVSTGTLMIAGGNNITLSQNGNAITISGGVGGGGGGAALSAGTQSASSGTVNFANSNGITFGMSGSSQITASHNGITSQSAQTLGLYLSGNTTGQSSSSTRDARSFTVSGGGLASVGLSNNVLQVSAQGIAGISGGGATFTNGSVGLSADAGALTITGSASRYSFRVPQTSSLSATGALNISANANTISIGVPAFSAGISTDGNTAGVTGFATNQVVLVGGTNITLSQTTGAGGNTISILAGGGGGGGATLSYFNPQDAYLQVNGTQGNATLHMQPTNAPNVTFDRVAFPIIFTGATNSTAQVTLSMQMGIYTRTQSTLSLSTSFTTAQAITHSGTANSSVNVGLRLLTMDAQHSLSEGVYYIGVLSRSSSSSANASISQILASQQNSNFSGIWGQASASTNQYTRGLGVLNGSTAALPSSVAFSQILGTNSNVLRQPAFYFVNGTV